MFMEILELFYGLWIANREKFLQKRVVHIMMFTADYCDQGHKFLDQTAGVAEAAEEPGGDLEI